MKSQIDLIDTKKKKQTNNLKKVRNQYVATVYYGIIHRKTMKQIHEDIKKITISNNNEGITYTRTMEDYALKLLKHNKRKADITFAMDVEPFIIAEWLFKRFQQEKVFTTTNTLAYEYAQKQEEKAKEEVIKDIEERAYNEKKVFYLCSKHNDCALDHIDYQGKIYVDERWESIIKDDALKGEIANYVIMNNIQTFQWVIGRPVWMTTRPNCRHFFKLLDNKEVLKSKNINRLLKKNKMYYATGRRETQTIRHSTKKEWYTKENVENIIRVYKERLEYHKALYEMDKKNTLIRRAIEKDRLLIRKWTDYLQKNIL